jgi:hypothetical protein
MVKHKKTTLKQKQIHHKHFFVGGIAAFFLAGLFLGGVVIVDLANRGQFSSSVHAFNPSQVISNAFYDVQLSSATWGSGESGSLKPDKDKTYFIVDLYVKNKSGKTLPLYPLSQTYIKDDQGQTYGVGPAMVLQPFQGGDLAPGDKIKGQIAYEIPISLKNPRFYLEGLSQTPVVVQF